MKNILDNRIYSKIFLPFAAFNLITSIRRFYKERKIIRSIIDENDEFYRALATLGFEPYGILGQLISTMPHDNTIQASSRLDTIHRTIIGVVNKFVKDENLLGIVFIDCEQSQKEDIVTINPISIKLLKIDVTDTIYALIIAICISITSYAIFAS